ATFWAVSRMLAGGTIGAEASLNKLWWSEMDLHMHETAMRLLGKDATLDGPWLDGFVFSLAGPIYAGTNEIQRNIVAERVLGLPDPLIEAAMIAGGALDGIVTAGVGTKYVAHADLADTIVLERDHILYSVPRESVTLKPVATIDAARPLFEITGGLESGTRFE